MVTLIIKGSLGLLYLILGLAILAMAGLALLRAPFLTRADHSRHHRRARAHRRRRSTPHAFAAGSREKARGLSFAH